MAAMNGRYSGVAIALHWAIAVLILINVAIGIDFADPAPGQSFVPRPLMPLHITIGIAVLLLSLARLGWRLTHAPPPHAPGMRGWEKTLASAAHWLFYGLIVGMPLTGWLVLSAVPRTDWLPGVIGFQWPRVPFMHAMEPAQMKLVHDLLAELHIFLATWIFLALLALHVAAIVKHHVFDRDPVIRRMWPFLK